MVPRGNSVIREIRTILETECKLQERYVTAMQSELKALTAFDSETVTLLAAERSGLIKQLASLEHRRLEIIKENSLPEENRPQPMRLTLWLERHCDKEDCAALTPLALKLRELIKKTHSKLREFGSVVDFTLGIVGGSSSLIWSATQNINKTYTAFGKMQTAYVPAGSTDGTVLKTA